MNCPTCSKRMRKVKQDYHFTESGLENIYLSGVEVYKCNCGETLARILNMQELLDTIGEAVVNKPGSLTGSEIRYLRKNIGLSSKAFAEYLHQTHFTLSKWENEKRNPSKDNDLLIRLCYAALMNYENSQQIIEMLVNLRGKKKHKINIKPSSKRGYDVVYS